MDWRKYLAVAMAAMPKNWPQILAWLVIAAVSSLAARYGITTPDVPPTPIPVWEPPAHLTHGWIENPDEVEKVEGTLGFRTFADTPAGKSDDPLPKSVFLWDAYRKKFGTTPPAKNQGQVGSCVSFGTNNAIARTMIVAIVLLGDNFDFKDISEEVTYAGSRVQVGKGRIGGDGSVGAWAAEFVQKWGVVAREKQGANDLTTYSESRCRSWGRTGVPADLQDVARQHPVKAITLVKTWDSAKKALASGYGIAVCSSQGFSMTRDANGVARPQGSWAHCMCLDGYYIDGNAEYGHIENSWGPDSHKGPVGWGNPSTAGFWAEAKTISRMLAEGDSWAFSNVHGFPSRKLDWFVLANPRRNDFTTTFGKGVDYAMAP